MYVLNLFIIIHTCNYLLKNVYCLAYNLFKFYYILNKVTHKNLNKTKIHVYMSCFR